MKLRKMGANLKSSSLKMATIHGIEHPKEYRDAVIHEWYLLPHILKHLHLYFLAKEKGSNLRNVIKNGELIVGNHSYSVIWLNRPEKCYNEEYCLLSFRYCTHLECGYVLIKTLQGKYHDNFDLVDYTARNK